MIRLKLVLKIKNEQNFTLSLGYGFRCFFYLFSIVIATLMLFDNQNNISLGPLIFCLIFLIFGSYHEAWIFNLQKGLIEQQHGLFFLFRKRSTPVSTLKSVHISSFTKGRNTKNQGSIDGKARLGFRPKKINSLYLLTRDDTRLDIEVTDDPQIKRLEKIGEIIASSCQIPLISDDE